MKKLYTLVQLITFLFSSTFSIYSQVTANFTMNPASGCKPLKVNFTNQSSGSGTLTYLWYLGGQQGTSTLKDPQATYIDAGIYQVKLVVSNGISKDSITKNVTVYKIPSADFVADQKGCVPDTVQFYDMSVKGDGVINHWSWDFRSGSIDTHQNPSHIYISAGKYDIFLEVTDIYGCKASIEKQQYIDVANLPVANFTNTPTFACKIPAVVQFNNTSSGQGTLTYNWNFGDNTSSAIKNPSKTYNQFGNFTIVLKVNSDYGCSSSVSKGFSITDIQASGQLTQGSNTITNNETICPGRIDYLSTSTGTTSVLWKFGDGSTSTGISGFHTYANPGTYTVSLIASPGNSCADTTTWRFTMENLRADFTMSSTYSCKSPASINFTDASTNASAWEWTFADGIKTTTKNTSHNYVLPPETDAYAVNTDVIYNTTLKVTSSNGCIASTTKPYRIKKPTARFKVNTSYGCMPLTVNFNDQSLSDETITKWEWIFGDGIKSSGAVNSASHQYANNGSYMARLVITNNLSCTDTSYAIPILTGKTLSPDFLISKSTVCPNEIIHFTDNTPQSSLIQSWHYFVEGRSVNAPADEPDPNWKVDADTGHLDVKLEVNYNGCISSATKPNAIFNQGSYSDFTYSVNCNTPFSYSFTTHSHGQQSFLWKFGDNATNNSTANPVHVYASEGNYQVELITFKNGCSDTARATIKVRLTQAKITGSSNACVGAPMVLKGDQSYGTVDFCQEKYLWDFGDNSQKIRTNTDSISHVYTSRGNYTIKLVAQYDNGCTDTTTSLVAAIQPHVNFDADTLYGCSPFTVTFSDLSTPDTYPISLWAWDFGDGKDTSYTSKKNTLAHKFNEPGVFNVTLTATDTKGCSGYDNATISTANPVAAFTATNPYACTSDDVRFTYNYITGDSVIWNFGDGTLSRLQNRPMTHAYSNKGNYTVSLTIYKYGCSDTYTRPSDYIQIQKADAKYSVSDSVWKCYPKEITFTYTPPEDIIASGTWSFGYNNSTSEYATVRQFNYPRPGIYPTSLSIQTTFGCRDTFSRDITISGPIGELKINPEAACKGEEITFDTIHTHNVYNFEWDLGDGRFTTGSPVTVTYQKMGKIYPKLILYGDLGICIPPPVIDSILIYEVTAGFEIPDTAHCAQYNFPFTNNSVGNTHNYWSFSNGLYTSETDPIVKFDEGHYDAELRVENDFGCSDTADLSFDIYPVPPMTISEDTFICHGNEITISATGGDNIVWVPSNGLTNNHAYTTDASPDVSTNYTAVVTDLGTGCRNSHDLTILVQQEPNITILPYPDTVIVIGEFIHMQVDSLGEFIYQWSPDSWLSCTNCAAPVMQPLENTTYNLHVIDIHNCFPVDYQINVEVSEKYSLEVPTGFTPNGDGVNDVIYVKGWGIKKLIEFKIFNRWGNQVFYSDDINKGWDGTYNGKIQNIDSYAYEVIAEMWDGRIVSKKGYINIIR